MLRYSYVLVVLVFLGLVPLVQAQSCYSQSSAAAPVQYSDDGGGGTQSSCYSQSYAAPQTQSYTSGCVNGMCYGSSCVASHPGITTTYRVAPRSSPVMATSNAMAPRYEYGIASNAIHFPEPTQDRLISTSPIPRGPVYQAPPRAYPPAQPRTQPRGRVRTVMAQPVYNQAQVVQATPQTAYQPRQALFPAFGSFLRGSGGGGCPGGVCR